jgi:hypothetical protein
MMRPWPTGGGAVAPKEKENYLEENYIMKIYIAIIGAIRPTNKRQMGKAGMQWEVRNIYIIVAGTYEGK